jgi:hypothetical protein
VTVGMSWIKMKFLALVRNDLVVNLNDDNCLKCLIDVNEYEMKYGRV